MYEGIPGTRVLRSRIGKKQKDIQLPPDTFIFFPLRMFEAGKFIFVLKPVVTLFVVWMFGVWNGMSSPYRQSVHPFFRCIYSILPVYLFYRSYTDSTRQRYLVLYLESYLPTLLTTAACFRA